MARFISASVEEPPTSTDYPFFNSSHAASDNSLQHSGQYREPQAKNRTVTLKTLLQTSLPTPPSSVSGTSSNNSPILEHSIGHHGYPSPRTPSPGLDQGSSLDYSGLPRTPVALPRKRKYDDGLPSTPVSPDSEPFTSPGLLTRPAKINGRASGRGRNKKINFFSTPSPSPDRFISSRLRQHDLSQTFRLSKASHQLSHAERLLRDRSASPDPFVDNPAISRRGRRLFPTNIDRQTSASSQRNPNSPNLLGISRDGIALQNRRASAGAVWSIGGANLHPSGPVEGVPDGRGGLVGSRTNAPFYIARFVESDKTEDDSERFESRLAAALDIDRSRRMLDLSRAPEQDSSPVSDRTKRKLSHAQTKTRWKHGQWVREGDISLLDAPQLRDDYYCSVLAYCHSRKTLAVGLSSRVYLWSETSGVHYPELGNERNAYVTSLSFSSHEGGHSILAIGRNDGHISLWSLFDVGTRFESQQPSAVACLAFKPVPSRRASERFGMMVMTEELLVGDELGNVYYYAIEWVSNQEVDIHGWHGAMSLLAKISVHSQQICGLAWSPGGEYFATGANDNACCLFEVKDILMPPRMPDSEGVMSRGALQPVSSNLDLPGMLSSAQSQSVSDGLVSQDCDSGRTSSETEVRTPSSRTFVRRVLPGQNGTLDIGEGREKHKWAHSAAIKAIAFCPWQRGLIATGGGSNDRAIHFYHTFSGACLATISVQAQVTSLIWSNSRREIAATFGYAQPEHPYRIAVFSWPDCRQVVAIPWASEMRALHAIPYPGGPNETGEQSGEGETWWSRTAEEGCIVVACSDESVKFHEVWTGKKKSVGGVKGLLGGSDILEAMEGFDKEGAEVIR